MVRGRRSGALGIRDAGQTNVTSGEPDPALDAFSNPSSSPGSRPGSSSSPSRSSSRSSSSSPRVSLGWARHALESKVASLQEKQRMYCMISS